MRRFMIWDIDKPAKAAAEACQEPYFRPRQRPHRSCALFRFSFLEDPPARVQWGARASGFPCGFLDPEKFICMGFAKNRLTPIQKKRFRPAQSRDLVKIACATAPTTLHPPPPTTHSSSIAATHATFSAHAQYPQGISLPRNCAPMGQRSAWNALWCRCAHALRRFQSNHGAPSPTKTHRPRCSCAHAPISASRKIRLYGFR